MASFGFYDVNTALEITEEKIALKETNYSAVFKRDKTPNSQAWKLPYLTLGSWNIAPYWSTMSTLETCCCRVTLPSGTLHAQKIKVKTRTGLDSSEAKTERRLKK